MTPVREKHHRLPSSAYRGRVIAAFTINAAEGTEPLLHPTIFPIALAAMKEAFDQHHGHVGVSVFMPNHVHWIVSGGGPASDLHAMVRLFKQKTAFRARKIRKDFAWQKDFYDHIIRATEDYGAQVRYLLRNPVRRGLCDRWEEWPYKVVLGQSWEQLITATATY